MGAEVALARSHLVDPFRLEFIEAHEGVGLEGGAVLVSGQVRCPGLPFFHEEVAAAPPLLWVGSPLGGVRVGFGKGGLRGHREEGVTVGPHEE